MGIFGNSWFAEGETPQGPLPYQEGLGGLLARVGAQATQPVPPEAWDDPAVQEKLQQWIEGMGAPPGLLTKILKPGLWRQLMTTPSINRAGQKVPRGTTSAWSEMRHTGTDYDVGAKLPIGRAMYRNQAGFNTGTEVALDLAKQAIGFRKPQYAQAIVDWLRMKAGEHGYQVGGTSWDEILKLLGPTK